MNKRRSDPGAAQRVVDSIFEGTSGDARRSYCQFLGASIAYLSQHHPDRWGVTLLEDKAVVRLNAGIVESLVLHPGGLRVLVHRNTAPPGTSFDGRRYRNAPGCETAAIPLSELPRSLPKLAESHHKALNIVAARPSFRNILNAHSTGVTKWLSQVLRRQVPNPVNPQRPVHIVQGGIQNGDKALLERLATGGPRESSWMVPKSADVGDEIVIYIREYGFFATARVKSGPRPSNHWKNRYRAEVDSLRLVQPPISLAVIRHHLPDLGWAKYPRSITTPPPEIADRIRALISGRRKRIIDLPEYLLEELNLDELRKLAMQKAHGPMPPKKRKAIYRTRSKAIRWYVLGRANGRCEGCLTAAPFRGVDGRPFLETHHTIRAADDGPDHPRTVIGICPNCHRRAHFAEDAESFNQSLIRKLPKLEAAAMKR